MYGFTGFSAPAPICFSCRLLSTHELLWIIGISGTRGDDPLTLPRGTPLRHNLSYADGAVCRVRKLFRIHLTRISLRTIIFTPNNDWTGFYNRLQEKSRPPFERISSLSCVHLLNYFLCRRNGSLALLQGG